MMRFSRIYLSVAVCFLSCFLHAQSIDGIESLNGFIKNIVKEHPRLEISYVSKPQKNRNFLVLNCYTFKNISKDFDPKKYSDFVFINNQNDSYKYAVVKMGIKNILERIPNFSKSMIFNADSNELSFFVKKMRYSLSSTEEEFMILLFILDPNDPSTIYTLNAYKFN